MKKRFFLLLILLAMFATGCKDSTNYQDDKDLLVTSQECETPPESFTWNKETYTLKMIGDRELEPGMKLGYLACNKGIYTAQGEGPNATFNIYTYGSSSNDILYFGQWGRALYISSKN
jgi:hypothetical protein